MAECYRLTGLAFEQAGGDAMISEWSGCHIPDRKLLHLENPIFSGFRSHRHTIFRLVGVSDYELELAEIFDHSNTQLEQFSLIFTSAALPWLQQGTYTLTHPDLTEVVLFIVPIGPDGNTMRYESVFSRLLKKHE